MRPLLKLAGVNVPSPARQTSGKYKQHTAHGIHGPAHSTNKRLSSSSHHQGQTAAAAGGMKKVELGRYDGGLEADEKEDVGVAGEASRVLEMDSAASG